jgi:hypothetical protein
MHRHLIALLGAGTITLGTVHVHQHTKTHTMRPPRPHTMHVATLGHKGRHRF